MSATPDATIAESQAHQAPDTVIELALYAQNFLVLRKEAPER